MIWLAKGKGICERCPCCSVELVAGYWLRDDAPNGKKFFLCPGHVRVFLLSGLRRSRIVRSES